MSAGPRCRCTAQLLIGTTKIDGRGDLRPKGSGLLGGGGRCRLGPPLSGANRNRGAFLEPLHISQQLHISALRLRYKICMMSKPPQARLSAIPTKGASHRPDAEDSLIPVRTGCYGFGCQPHRSTAAYKSKSPPWHQSFLLPGHQTFCLSEQTPLSSEFGTIKTVKARFWPWLEPFSERKSSKPCKLLPFLPWQRLPCRLPCLTAAEDGISL